MSTVYNDTITYKKAVTFDGGVSFGAGAVASESTVKYATKAFVLANITGGSLTFVNGTDIPANTIILGCWIKTTTAPAFSAGTTTGLTAKVGSSGDDDGYGLAVSIAGSAGIKAPDPGVLVGKLNTTGAVAVAFTATGGTPTLSEVSAGAGSVVVAYTSIPA